MPPAAPRLTPEPGIIVDAPKSVAGKFSDDDKLIFWNRHGDDTANGPLYAMGAVKAGFPVEAKTLAEAVKILNPMDAFASGQWMDEATKSGDYPNTTFCYTAIRAFEVGSERPGGARATDGSGPTPSLYVVQLVRHASATNGGER